MKRCRRCQVEKPIDDFYRHSRMADGHLNICKSCKCEYQASRPKERIAEIDRKRQQKPERRRKKQAYTKKWRRNNPEKVKDQRNRYPEKYKARAAVGNAIRDGRLNRLPCEVCGYEKTEGHHEDYSKPLEVVWLCKECHDKRHRHIDS